METVGTAHLTDRIPAERAVVASVSRREIRDVLQGEEAAPELTLDVVAGDGSHAHGTVSMTWSREDLEELLEGSGDDVILTFDRNELAAVLSDVEAHGLRTRGAVFAVAAVGALGSGASIANAMPAGDGIGSNAAAATTVQSDAAEAALQTRSEAMNAQFGLADSPSDATVTDASTSGYVAPAQGDAALAALQARSEAMNAQFGLAGSPSNATVTDASTSGYVAPAQGDAAQAALQARSVALNEQYGLTAGGQNDPAVQALEARGAAMNAELGLGDSPSGATVTDASTGGYVDTAAASGGGIEFQSPSTNDAVLAGLALLTIAGATFAVRRTSTRRPARPA
jgi:hypothetical protein